MPLFDMWTRAVNALRKRTASLRARIIASGPTPSMARSSVNRGLGDCRRRKGSVHKLIRRATDARRCCFIAGAQRRDHRRAVGGAFNHRRKRVTVPAACSRRRARAETPALQPQSPNVSRRIPCFKSLFTKPAVCPKARVARGLRTIRYCDADRFESESTKVVLRHHRPRRAIEHVHERLREHAGQ